MRWALAATLYFIGVLTLGLLLMGLKSALAASLDFVFLLLAIMLFRLALRDVSLALDIAMEDKERAELRMVQVLLVTTFCVAACVLAYGALSSLMAR
ncbi:MAG: hypothetical protein LM577_00675 [Thermoproteaceae archaeon]|jgi:hypothetical protein|nr:hypothetical protein [Thermoproteaceae archaeon]